MLDQNTDRMWYVIGAVLVGAAIILIANGTMPQLFATVTDSFQNVLGDVIYIGPIDMTIDRGSKNYNNTVDIKIFANSESGISDIELIDGPEIVSSKTVLSFDGEESYLDMRYNFGKADSFTVGAWLNDVDTHNFLVNHDTDGGWAVLYNSGIKVNESKGKWLRDEDNERIEIPGRNETNHVVQTWDGDTVTHYFNGVEIGTYSGISGSFELESLFIGARSNPLIEATREPTIRSSGQILEFFMYKNKSLSSQEVENAYNNGINSNDSNLVLHYDFVNGSGDIIPDKSGSGRNAINHGGKWVPMYNVSENGTYTFKVTDNDGNVREENVTVRGL